MAAVTTIGPTVRLELTCLGCEYHEPEPWIDGAAVCTLEQLPLNSPTYSTPNWCKLRHNAFARFLETAK